MWISWVICWDRLSNNYLAKDYRRNTDLLSLLMQRTNTQITPLLIQHRQRPLHALSTQTPHLPASPAHTLPRSHYNTNKNPTQTPSKSP